MSKLDTLQPWFRSHAALALEAMTRDKALADMGVKSIFVVETSRTLAVQMAYVSRLLAYYTAKYDPKYKALAIEFVQNMYKAAGLYAISADKAIVPNSWTLHSKHLENRAMDIAPSKDGKTIWWAPADHPVWKRMAEIAEGFGIEAGRNWPAPQTDAPHFQEKDK